MYKNDRDPHVEIDRNDLSGRMFVLGRRITRKVGNNVAIMYEIPDLPKDNSNNAYKTHITTYFGPIEGSEIY